MALGGARIVLGVSGSIAAYKAAELARALGRAGAEVQPILTPAATRFIPALTLSVLTGREALVDVFPDAERPGSGAASAWTKHVELGLWADAVVVAPATAQTMASLANGFCDSLLAAVVLSARCPVMVAPAMDHDMWHHPATQRNVDRLRADGVEVVEPASGPLASGLVGQGRLPEPDSLVAAIDTWLGKDSRLNGKTVMVTAGPTREAVDPVRFLSNGSTGTMGFEIAAAAARRGARVTLLAGPVALETPRGVARVDVVTADDLLREALQHADADVVIAAAAVSDYAPADVSDLKLSKTDPGSGPGQAPELVLRLRRTPDVLAALGERKRPGQTLVGFALETHDGEAHARAKLERKNLDWIALNSASAPGEGFGTRTNRLTLLAADGRRVDVPLASKRAVAEALLDAVTA